MVSKVSNLETAAPSPAIVESSKIMRMGTQAVHRPPMPTTLILAIILLVFPSVSLAARDAVSEALLKFKSSLTNTGKLDNWDPNTFPCSGDEENWSGVMCSRGEVWGLQLENMNLKGQIDIDALVPVKSLRSLSFKGNGFTGQMPDWRKLGALKSLYLSNNQFLGTIPDDAFKGMTSLKKVHLENNKFTGNIPASLASPRLLELNLENNQFTGSIPDFKADHLKLLNLSNNRLEGPIPPSLAKRDQSSFAGNNGLCGGPLKSCDAPIAPDEQPSPGPSGQPPAGPPGNSPAITKKKSSAGRIAIIVSLIILGLILIIILVLLYIRSRSDQTPQLGRTVSPPPYTENLVAHSAAVQVKSGPAVAAAVPKKADQPGKLSFVKEDRRNFDLQDLMRASAEVLGSGNFGASYKAVLVDGEALVVKRFKQMNNIGKEDFHEHMRRLGRLQHPNLLPLVAYLYRKEEKLLVFDFVSNGSLATHLHGKPSEENSKLNWPTRLKIIKGVTTGLAYIYRELPSLSVPHGHLKSSNVLLDKSFTPLLMDYSLVPVVNPGSVHKTLVAYKSPEYSQHGCTSKKMDVWCLGILILETLTGKFVAKYLSQGTGYDDDLAEWINDIVQEDNIRKVFDQLITGSIEESRGQMKKLLEIGIACCQEDMDKRWDLEEVVDRIQQVQETDR